MKSVKHKELDDELNKIQSDLTEMQMASLESLAEDQERLDRIEKEKLVKVDNEIKKANWFRKGMKSSGRWLINLFSTPKLKSEVIESKPAPEQEKKVYADGFEGELDKFDDMVRLENKTIRDQNKQIGRLNKRLDKQNHQIEKINQDIKRI